MSAEHSIRIVPSGGRCDTDGETIHIPFTSDYLPPEARQLLHGMLDHEVCHVIEERRHKEALQKSPLELMESIKTDARLALLLNVVEDVRIELRYSAIYVGVAQNLKALNLSAAKAWEERAAAGEVNWWNGFCAALIMLGHKYDVSWADAVCGDYLRLCKDEIAAMCNGVGEWASASLAIARRIFDKVKDKFEEDKPPPKGSEPSDSEEDGDGGKKMSTPEDDPDGDMLEPLRRKVEEYVIHDAKLNARYIPHPKAIAKDVVEVALPNTVAYNLARTDAFAQVRVLRQKQRALVASWARRRVRPGRERGDIDDQMLSDVRVGARDLFTELTDKRQLNTAITGLVDCSGSMGHNEFPGHCAYYAARTAIALSEAWTALGVANEWLGYSASDTRPTGITEADLDGPYFCRPPLLHLVFKAYDERLCNVRTRFGDIRGRGSNVDGEAFRWALQRLLVRSEPRKFLVMICDGRPLSSNGCHEKPRSADTKVLQAHLREEILRATQAGVEVLGIGAGTAAPAAYFNADTGAKFVHISDVRTLAVDVFRVMKQRTTRF